MIIKHDNKKILKTPPTTTIAAKDLKKIKSKERVID